MPYNFFLFLFNFLFLAWTRLEISVLEGRSATMSQHYLVAIASILSMLVFIALVQLAQTSSADATAGRGRWLLQLESIADRAGSCARAGYIFRSVSDSGSGFAYGNTMHDAREI